MKRREFIMLLGGAAVAWPLGVRAQQQFRAGLREHGYIEGQNIAFEFRSAEGKPERLRGLADELVRLKVDIIVAHMTPSVTARNLCCRM